MKKIKILLCSILICFVICGCGKDTVDTYADVSNSGEKVSSNKGDSLTVGNVYDYIRENNNSIIIENILKKAIKSQLDFTDEDISNLYKKYVNEEFKSLFIDKGTYNYNGGFNEELLVDDLKSKSYDIKCGSGYNAGVLDIKYFTCDYTDYIEKTQKTGEVRFFIQCTLYY